jgi:DNA-binding CsgD family transcriptional regulator
LTAKERKSALQIYRSGSEARLARRAHILLLLAAGRSYREIMDIDFASSALVADVKRRFLEDGLEAALAEPIDP